MGERRRASGLGTAHAGVPKKTVLRVAPPQEGRAGEG
jgi:hypothetical protein